MRDDLDLMSEWIVRVEGKEYGPADLTTLREWKGEGRVIPSNQARQVDVDLWTTAAEIPDLFEKPPPPPPPPRAKKPPRQRRPPVKIFRRTLQIYGKGFSQFFCLSLLVILPSACAQLTAVFLDRFPNVEGDLRAALGAGVELCMLMLLLVVWPIYLAGIQVLTAHISAGRRLGFVNALNEAVRFWPRMASGCVFVYLSYVFWTILPLTVILMIGLSGPSLVSLFLILLVLSFQVWMTGRLFSNFLFWQQCIVLDGLPAPEALRESKRVARSGHHLPGPRRPLWRGVFIASLWFAFVLIVNLWPVWPMVQHYFHELSIAQDLQALLDAMKASAKTEGFNLLVFGLSVLQGVLRPLLGIAFVLLYVDAKEIAADEPENAKDEG
jgi:hypothetical protein